MARLEDLVVVFLDFGSAFPAFVDCAQALLRRRGDELMEEVSERVMFDLGRAMTSCLNRVVDVLEAGIKAGEFHVRDPYLLANVFYTQALGVMNLATLQLSVREQNPGLPAVDAVPIDEVKVYLQHAAVAMARAETVLTRHPAAAARTASTDRRTSRASVDQLLTEMRSTSRPCQREPDIQVVPSAISRAVTSRVRSSLPNATQTCV